MICFVFESARSVIKAEELLSSQGQPCRVVPAPSEISSSCGMMLSVEANQVEAVKESLDKKSIKYKIYER